MAKRLLMHRYSPDGSVESTAYSSRTELARRLRSDGIRFADSMLCDIDDGLVVLHGSDGTKYEVEELVGDGPDDIVMVNGRAYFSIGKYCRDTGRTEREVYRAYHLDRRK